MSPHGSIYQQQMFLDGKYRYLRKNLICANTLLLLRFARGKKEN